MLASRAAAVGSHQGITKQRERLKLQNHLFRTTSLVSMKVDALEALEPAGRQLLQSRKYQDLC